MASKFHGWSGDWGKLMILQGFLVWGNAFAAVGGRGPSGPRVPGVVQFGPREAGRGRRRLWWVRLSRGWVALCLLAAADVAVGRAGESSTALADSGLAGGTNRTGLPVAPVWLPEETVSWLTIPDWRQFREAWSRSGLVRLWADPAMEGFRRHFLKAWREEVLEPLERRWAVSWRELADWPQGQWTWAVVTASGEGGSDRTGGILMLMEVGNRVDRVRKHLTALQQRWVATGRSVRTETVRGVSFVVLSLPGGGWVEAALAALQDRAESPPEDRRAGDSMGVAGASPRPFEVAVGLCESALLVCDQLGLLERVVARLQGQPVSSLEATGRIEPEELEALRSSLLFGAVHPPSLLAAAAALDKGDAPAGDSAMPLWAIFVRAAGLAEAKSVSWRVLSLEHGWKVQLTLNVPQEKRTALVGLLDLEPLEASPPDWVPAEVLRFHRGRLDGARACRALEQFFGRLSETWTRTWEFLWETAQQAGRQQDPSFDVRREVLENLGDDWIYWQVTPRGSGWEDLEQAPSLLLVGSPRAERLAAGLAKVLAGAALRPDALEEREFLGRRFYSVVPPLAMPSQQASGAARRLHFVASERYVGFAFEPALLENWLRNMDTPGASLARRPGWREALAAVGGGRGWVGYEDYAALAKYFWWAARSDPGHLPQAQVPGPLGFRLHLHSDPEQFRRWFDPQALPAWEAVGRYFGFGLVSLERDRTVVRVSFLTVASPAGP